MNRLYVSFILYLFFLLATLLGGCSRPGPDKFVAPVTSTAIQRGASIVKGLGACGFCHGTSAQPSAPLAGGRDVYDLYGGIAAANITPSKSGIGKLTDEEIVLSLRGLWSEAADKRSPTIHRGFEWIASSDALSIVGYLRTLTPVKNEVPTRKVGFTSRNSTGLFSAPSKVTGHIAETSRSNPVVYGKYLINHVARCGSCHTTVATIFSSEKYLAGETIRTVKGNIAAPSLIGSKKAMSNWSEAQIYEFFKAGLRPNRSKVDSTVCPVDFYKEVEDSDLQAIVLYLRSL